MPIYAYKCEACGHAHDALQKMSDALLRDCPACGKAALVKQVTAAGFQLKGSGWYVTDFRSGNGGKSAPAVATDSADAAASAASAAPAGTTASDTPAASPAAGAVPAPAPAAVKPAAATPAVAS